MARRDAVVVLGPTASGKSDLAMQFALETASAEIVAVDAMQVYRRMDIGTAKPTAADQAAVPHHGIDLVEPSADFAVPEFVAAVCTATDDITARGALAVLVAGTGLYLRTITDPMEMPGTWPDLRTALEARAETDGVDALHAELVRVDPDAATKMEPTNARRIVRALEVWQGSGRRFSSFGPGLDSYPPVPFRMLGLRRSRAQLAERIAARVHTMISAGFVDEVAALVREPDGLSKTARQALGYKELIAHLDGEATLDDAIGQIIVRTRQFAVRQERWFRRDPRIHWVDLDGGPGAKPLTVLREWTER